MQFASLTVEVSLWISFENLLPKHILGMKHQRSCAQIWGFVKIVEVLLYESARGQRNECSPSFKEKNGFS